MKNSNLFVLISFFGIFLMKTSLAQTENKFLFETNRNQFPSTVKYKIDIPGARLFIEKNKFIYVKYNTKDLERIHDAKQKNEGINQGSENSPTNDIVHLYSFQAQFVNSNPNVVLSAEKKSTSYVNYFIGNNPAKWSPEVYSYEKITYKNLYPNIDLIAYSQENQFKYDFIIQANADPNQIQIQYEGAQQIQIKNNSLIIKTSIGDVVESIPLAYQIINNKHITVPCNYQLLNENKVTFQFPAGYNKNYPLIIDPVLIAATYSGGTVDTYGHSATYDNNGNIYTGGECFGVGYPATTGAYDVSFAGFTDIAISKLNPNGSNLIWATYLGGSNDEIPNSLFVNNSGEIYIYGASASTDYPVSVGCYDNSANGQYDIIVTHLNATGTALIGSTYIGGTNDDGFSFVSVLNGHDGMRGEIIVDQANNAWIASYTASSNFPTSFGTYDATYNGGIDACVIKLSPDLSSLLWSTYLGGANNDQGYGLMLNTLGELYVTGYTASNAFPATAGSYQNTFQGGTSDGFIAKFNNTGSILAAASYFGTNSSDISYFIALDNDENPYIFGATTGIMPVTAGVYSNPSAGNFISKLDINLTAIVLSTTVGSSGSFLEPEAFMIDTCDNIYIAGFNSTSSYPVTAATALYTTQTAALGGTCYLMVLSKDASSLLYGSFYFGWHVDGGTSRFDPSGSIYLGICMGATVPTPTWAWDNAGPSWDMFVLKIDFQMTGVTAVASIAPNDSICQGQLVTFNNTSNGVQYVWDFGDGTPLSTIVSPTHLYSAPGIYTVFFLAIDSSSCNEVDSTFLTVTVFASPNALAGNDTNSCSNPIQLYASGGTSFTWTPSTGLSNPFIYNPIANPIATTTYIVEVSNGICSDFDTITIYTTGPTILSSNESICEGESVTLSSSGGINYSWSPAAGLSSTSIPNPVANPITTTTYTVIGTDANGCTGSSLLTVLVNPIISSDFTVSPASPYYLNDLLLFSDPSSIANTWDLGDNTSSTVQSLEHSYPTPGIYTICHTLITGCADTVCKTIEVTPFDILIPNIVTPNGDQQNEFLLFQYLEYYPGSKIEIYDRWGLKLYENDNYENNWDGSSYSDGVYYYILYLRRNNTYTSIPGFFHLLKDSK